MLIDLGNGFKNDEGIEVSRIFPSKEGVVISPSEPISLKFLYAKVGNKLEIHLELANADKIVDYISKHDNMIWSSFQWLPRDGKLLITARETRISCLLDKVKLLKPLFCFRDKMKNTTATVFTLAIL